MLALIGKSRFHNFLISYANVEPKQITFDILSKFFKSGLLWFNLFPASSPPREGKHKRPSPWFSGGNRRTDSEGKDDKKSEGHRKNNEHNDSRTNQGNGSKQHGRQDQRQRAGSKNSQQRQQTQPGYRPRGNSGNQFRPNTGSLSANWRDRSLAQSEAATKDKTKEAETKKDERNAEQNDEDKDVKVEEKVKENGDVKSPDEKPSGPVTDEKPADTNAVKSESTETKSETAQEN